MEEMISRWIRETICERENAKQDQNLYKMTEMKRLITALQMMRDRLMKSMP